MPELNPIPRQYFEDPKGQAGSLKPPMNLLHPDFLEELALVLGGGAKEYGPWNFLDAPVRLSTYIAALQRHLLDVMRGIDVDAKSGKAHTAHIAANAMIMFAAAKRGNLVDDRPKFLPPSDDTNSSQNTP